MSLLIKFKFHTPMIRFIGKRDGLPHPTTPQQPLPQREFTFDNQPRLLSTVQPISEKVRNIINLGGVFNLNEKKKPVDISKSK